MEKAITLGEMLDLGADGIVRINGRVATPSDVPIRTDLPEGHPLLGRRALRVVPSGMPDCTVDAEGRLVPVTATTEPIDQPIEPGRG